MLSWREKAPGVKLALPTHEHYAPLLVAQGAAAGEKTSFPIEGWWMGGFSKRSVQFG